VLFYREHGVTSIKRCLTDASRVPITTYRLAPQSGNFATPRIEGLGYEPTLFDLL